MQMWGNNDRDTRRGRVSKTGTVKAAKGGLGDWKQALGGRAVSKKQAEEAGDMLGAFVYLIYEFPFFLRQPIPCYL